MSPGVELDHLFDSAKEFLQDLLEEGFCSGSQCSVVADKSEMWLRDVLNEKGDKFFYRESPLYFRASPFLIGAVALLLAQS